MKTLKTKKSMKQSAKETYSVGYCGLQFLLRYREPEAYSAGAEGWACDYYRIGDVLISTGYNPTGKNISYKTVNAYNEMAKNALNHPRFTDEEKREVLEIYIEQFIEEVEA